MGVRVKLRIAVGGRVVEAVALASTRFETDESQLLIPYIFLARNGIDLKDLGKPIAVEYDAVEGSITIPVYPEICGATVVELDRVFKEIETDLVISFIEKEILMSNALIGELGIDIINLRTGLWKFINNTPNTIRKSYEQQL
ncbi:MAG: hypothetical protein LM568_05285 [Desulfurococcaceae archaeon]|nr:hypothetical protein [Desulfurococcaceae archaeon]